MLFLLLTKLNPNLTINELNDLLSLADQRKHTLISLISLDDIEFEVCIDTNPEDYDKKYCLSGILKDTFIIDGIEFDNDITYEQYEEFSKTLYQYCGMRI